MNTKPIAIKGYDCKSDGIATNDNELTLRDLVAVERLGKLRGEPIVHQKSAEGRKRRIENSQPREPKRHPNGFNGREKQDTIS